MKKLTCEMCGSTNLLKENGVFVCQTCGTKYSVEEAKKMMCGEESTCESVKSSSKLKNLYEIARRAVDTNDTDTAIKYYDEILTRDPNSWEAYFYTVYLRATITAGQDIEEAANSITNSMDVIIKLGKDHVCKEEDEDLPLAVIYTRIVLMANSFNNTVKTNFDALDNSAKEECVQIYVDCACASAGMLYALGDSIASFYSDDPAGMMLAAGAWESAIDIHNSYLACLENKDVNIEIMQEYIAKIKAIKNDYVAPKFKTSNGGCYIATAVYGSYDCPEVWTLRRFRDYTLAGTWYGRAFIRTYYAVSPTMVKWFGKSQWFKNMFQPLLDKLVNRLHSEGVADTPYNDKVW